jgi:hypothetical protein
MLLPPALLLTVAGLQIALVHTADLSPWLGGGFGMFSTTDAPGARHVHVYAITAGVERELAVGDAHRELARRAGALPIDTHLAALAHAFQSEPVPEEGQRQATRVQVWRTRFDPNTLVPSSELLREQDFFPPHD